MLMALQPRLILHQGQGFFSGRSLGQKGLNIIGSVQFSVHLIYLAEMVWADI